MIEVEPLDASESESWDSFLLSSPGGLVYHTIAYRNLLIDVLGCGSEYLVAREGGEIRGVLPTMWSGADHARVYNSLPFYGSHGGPIASTPEVEAALIAEWNERATDAETVAATVVMNPFLRPPTAEPVHGMTDERISQVTPLPRDPDDIWQLISEEARNNVRKAHRRGVSVRQDNTALARVLTIHEQNMRALGGQAKPGHFFAALPKHLEPGVGFDAWVAEMDGNVVAALLVLRFGGVAEYYTSGTLRQHRAHNPHAALLVAAMRAEVERGSRCWNWGGTWFTQEGVFRFKRKWGAREGRYRYLIQVNDRSLLDETAQGIAERFPHFYVLPYSALGKAQGRASLSV